MSQALVWRLYQAPIVIQSYEQLPPPPRFRWIARPSRLTRLPPPHVAPGYSARPPAIDSLKLAYLPSDPC